jgi:hypothetical protein
MPIHNKFIEPIHRLTLACPSGNILPVHEVVANFSGVEKYAHD